MLMRAHKACLERRKAVSDRSSVLGEKSEVVGRIKLAQLPFLAKLAIAATFYNSFVLFEEVVIDRRDTDIINSVLRISAPSL